MKILKLLYPLLLVLPLTSCSDDKQAGDHVWKEQTATIDKAKDVESAMMKAAEERAKSLERKAQ